VYWLAASKVEEMGEMGHTGGAMIHVEILEERVVSICQGIAVFIGWAT